MAVLKAKGSAEAATSPSHGSNNPRKGNAVNEQHNTTATAIPAMPDWEGAFDALQEPIDVVRRRVRAATYYVRSIFDREPDDAGYYRVYLDEVDALDSVVTDMWEGATQVELTWTKYHNERCEADRVRSNNYRNIPIRSLTTLLIERHRAAREVLGAAMVVADESKSPESEAALMEASGVEADAISTLLRHRPHSMAEAADRLEHLFGYHGPWHGSVPSPEEIAEMVSSMRGGHDFT